MSKPNTCNTCGGKGGYHAAKCEKKAAEAAQMERSKKRNRQYRAEGVVDWRTVPNQSPPPVPAYWNENGFLVINLDDPKRARKELQALLAKDKERK